MAAKKEPDPGYRESAEPESVVVIAKWWHGLLRVGLSFAGAALMVSLLWRPISYAWTELTKEQPCRHVVYQLEPGEDDRIECPHVRQTLLRADDPGSRWVCFCEGTDDTTGVGLHPWETKK